MKMLMRVSLGVVVLAGVAVFSVGFSETIIKTQTGPFDPEGYGNTPKMGTFDYGRFGDSTAGYLDSGKQGQSGGLTATGTGSGLSGTGAVATGGIQVGPVKDVIIVSRDENGKYTAETSVLGVDKTNTPEGKKAILEAANAAGEGLTMDELEGKVPPVDNTKTGAVDKPVDATQAAKDAKSQKMCEMNSADASKMAGDDAALQSKVAAKGGEGASAACIKALKDGLKACAKGDQAAFDKAKAEGGKECELEPDATGVDVATPSPISTSPIDIVQNAGTALEQGLQQAQGMIGKMLGGNLMQGGGMQGILNMVGQQMVSQLLEKLTGGGESGGGGDDGGESYVPPADENPTCDSVTATKDATKVEVVSAVTVTTVLVIDSCKNGHLRTRSTITMEYPNGTSETKNSETIK